MYKQLMTLTVGILLPVSLGLAQQDRVNQWCEATTDKMAKFLPQPAEGLIPREPWSPGAMNNLAKTCGDAVQNWKYLKPRAEQAWWFDDPVLAQQIAAVEKEQRDAQQQAVKGGQSWLAEIQALQKHYEELIQQNKFSEADAVAEKINSINNASNAKSNELDERIKHLQGRSRTVDIQVHGNEALVDALARVGKRPQPSGTIKGHPVYRVGSNMVGGPESLAVYLAIYLGLDGFRNPPVAVPSVTAGPKCFVVLVELHTRSDAVQSDEAVARKMLAAIDYDGLAKLIEP